MIYVALLRGVNVGGNNKINMQALTQAFLDNGFENVITYINSGNIIFSLNEMQVKSLLTTEQINLEIEKLILNSFNLSIKVLTLSFTQIESIIKAIPSEWTNDDDWKTDVMFLWPELDNVEILESLIVNDEIDSVIYTKGALISNIKREFVTESRLNKLASTKTYKQMTVRNVNTTRKLFEIISECMSK
jgi:uncharacterized protein (DUF1697 family)